MIRQPTNQLVYDNTKRRTRYFSLLAVLNNKRYKSGGRRWLFPTFYLLRRWKKDLHMTHLVFYFRKYFQPLQTKSIFFTIGFLAKRMFYNHVRLKNFFRDNKLKYFWYCGFFKRHFYMSRLFYPIEHSKIFSIIPVILNKDVDIPMEIDGEKVDFLWKLYLSSVEGDYNCIDSNFMFFISLEMFKQYYLIYSYLLTQKIN